MNKANHENVTPQRMIYAEHLCRLGELAGSVEIRFKAVKATGGLDAKLSREIAEQIQIERILDRRVEYSKTSSLLTNKVNPIGKSRINTFDAKRQ